MDRSGSMMWAFGNQSNGFSKAFQESYKIKASDENICFEGLNKFVILILSTSQIGHLAFKTPLNSVINSTVYPLHIYYVKKSCRLFLKFNT